MGCCLSFVGWCIWVLKRYGNYDLMKDAMQYYRNRQCVFLHHYVRQISVQFRGFTH